MRPNRGTIVAVALAMLAAVAVVTLTSRTSAGETVDLDTLRTANLLYQDGQFDEAARSYERLAGLGYEDATLYYNLANAYYKNDDPGRALLNYLRARRLAPFDDDIAANLALLREEVGTADSEIPPSPTLALIAERAPWVSLNVAAGAALLCWAALWAVGIACVWKRSMRMSAALRRVAASAFVGLVVFGGLALGGQMSEERWRRVAVVTASSTEARDQPSSHSRIQVDLDAGREVIVVSTRAGWTRIRLPRTDIVGWAPSSDIETLLPRAPSPIPDG